MTRSAARHGVIPWDGGTIRERKPADNRRPTEEGRRRGKVRRRLEDLTDARELGVSVEDLEGSDD